QPQPSAAQQITTLTVALLLLAGATTGLVGFAAMEQHVARSITQGLQAALHARLAAISRTLPLHTDSMRIITTHPNLLKPLRLMTDNAENIDARVYVQGLLESFTTHGFTAIAVALASGEEVAHTGAFVATPSLIVPLTLDTVAWMLWQDGMYLRATLPLKD